MLSATFSNSFSRNEVIVFLFKFHSSLFHKVQMTASQQWFRRRLGAENWLVIIFFKNGRLIY